MKTGEERESVSGSSPSGEVGFRAMSESLGWAKRPMLQRVHLLPPSMPVTMLYGALSWVDSSSGERTAQIRKQAHTKVLVSRPKVRRQPGGSPYPIKSREECVRR